MTTPFDLATEQQAIERKRQLAQVLLQRSMQAPQGQMVSGHYIAPGFGAYLAPLVSAFASRKLEAEADDASRQLAATYNSRLSQGLEKYFDTREGKAGQVMTDQQVADLMQNDQAPQLADPVAANPRRAAVEALTSGIGPLQQLGMSDLQQLGKGGLTQKEILSLSGYDPKSRLVAALGGNIGALQPERREHVVNGRIVVGNPDGGYSTAGDFSDKYSGVGVIGRGEDGKPIYGQSNTRTGEVKFAPTGTQVNVNTTQKAGDRFATELAGKRADTLVKSYENALAAKKAIEALESAEDDFAAGIKSGATGQVALGISKWAKALGIDADPQIANTEAFRANMARETLNLVKGLGAGTGISNADREFAEKASGGSILLDDGAMYRLMNIAKAAAANVQMEHNRLLDAQVGATGSLPQDLETFRVPFNMKGGDQLVFDEATRRFVVKAPSKPAAPTLPAAPGKTAPGTMSVQEWLSK